MAFIGNTNQTQAFTPAVDYFNGTGSTTAFTLSRPVASVAQIQVVVDNVPQNPSSAYTVSGNTITFTSAPLSGTNNIYVEYTSPITQVNALSQSPSIVGDLTTSGGHYAVGSFNSGYTDGTVMDYVSGLGRISVGTSDGLAFYRGGVANTESMRIDSSGNVGIGTSSPANKLHVVDPTNDCSIYFQATGSGGTTNRATYLYLGGTISGYNGIISLTSGTENWSIKGGGTSNAIAFNTGSSSTERMRIDSSGNVLVGQTSQISAERLGITASVSNFTSIITNTAASNPYGIKMRYTGSSPNNTGSWFFYAEDSAAAQKFGVASNGGIQNYSANNTNLSDQREKTNIKLADSYLDKICAIPVKTFNFINQNMEEDDGLTLGVIAQDVQAVAPELVMESNWAGKDEPEKLRLSIYQTDLQYALMKCIQELKAEVDALKAQIGVKQ